MKNFLIALPILIAGCAFQPIQDAVDAGCEIASVELDNKRERATITCFNPHQHNGENYAMTFDPKNVKVKRAVTLPLLKKEDGKTIYIKIESAIYKGKELKQKKGEAEMAAADLCKAINLETGQLCEVICNTVMKARLEEEYPAEAYVGKAFAITQNKVEGKRYKTYEILEIEVPTDTPTVPESTAANASKGKKK